MPFANSDLTIVRRRLARACELLDLQQVRIQKLRADGQDTSHAEAAFRKMRRTLEACEAARRRIEDELIGRKASAQPGR
jgi:hypothetical protein